MVTYDVFPQLCSNIENIPTLHSELITPIILK